MKKSTGTSGRYMLFAPFVNNKNRNRFTFYEPEWFTTSHLETVESIPASVRKEFPVWNKVKKYFSRS